MDEHIDGGGNGMSKIYDNYIILMTYLFKEKCEK